MEIPGQGVHACLKHDAHDAHGGQDGVGRSCATHTETQTMRPAHIQERNERTAWIPFKAAGAASNGIPGSLQREPEVEGPWSRERHLRDPETSVPGNGLEDARICLHQKTQWHSTNTGPEASFGPDVEEALQFHNAPWTTRWGVLSAFWGNEDRGPGDYILPLSFCLAVPNCCPSFGLCPLLLPS